MSLNFFKKTLLLKFKFPFFFYRTIYLSFPILFLTIHNTTASEEKERPLTIIADETISTQQGKLTQATGNVHILYRTETGDTIHSFSKHAWFNNVSKTGKMWGHPKAFWKTKNGFKKQEPTKTKLTAKKFMLDIEKSNLSGIGNALIEQTSSTLKADQISYFNDSQKLIATGNTPLFKAWDNKQIIQVYSTDIITWRKERRIQFHGNVKGEITFFK